MIKSIESELFRVEKFTNKYDNEIVRISSLCWEDKLEIAISELDNLVDLLSKAKTIMK